MDIIYFLIGCSMLVAALFLGIFLWAMRSGQFDDTTTPAYRILFDAAPEPTPTPDNDSKPAP
jgi:cbb3-type cytochrome oxidase maturation protein